MGLFRLAKIEDYIPVKVGVETLYQIKWDSSLCPGNPTADPKTGVHEYNSAKIRLLQTKGEKSNLDTLFKEAINWCLVDPSTDAKTLCKYIRDNHFIVTDTIGYPAKYYLIALSLMPERFSLLTAETNLKIRVKAGEQ